jgi:DNA polymerase-3 subunit gamma/tau
MLTRLRKIAQDEGLQIEDEVLERIIDKSDGALRDAESLLGQISTLTHNAVITVESVDLVLPASPFGSVLALLDFLSQKDVDSALNHVAQLTQSGISADYFLAECLEALRIILHTLVTKKIPSHNRILGDNHVQLIQKISAHLTVNDVVRLLDITLKRRQDSRFSPIPELPIDLLVVEYCSFTQEKNALLNTTPTATPHSPQTHTPSTQKKDTPTEKDLAQKNSVTKNSQQPTISALEEKNQTPSNFTAQTLSLEELQSQWKKIIEWVGSKSHSLTFILNTAKIARMDGLRVSLNVPYDFHREKLMESKNKKLIEQAMQELTGVPLLIQCDVGAETAADIGGLNALAASFGGEIVAT